MGRSATEIADARPERRGVAVTLDEAKAAFRTAWEQ
jgi:hypothetical protein